VACAPRSAASSGSASRRAAGLTNQRGNDYFPYRLMFPLADARGRIVGFQARKLLDDDPLRGKYVNSPEGELFHKSSVLYGLNLARTAISKQERAVVVEGNTDVIALRQAGFEPAVASMGTALTERQLKELQRLTRKLYLCFDSDAAGEEATLRGMELAAMLGFDVRVVSLPKGQDPADAPDGFEERLVGASSYVVHLTRLTLDRETDRQEAFVKVKEILSRFPSSPERDDAVKIAAGRLQIAGQTMLELVAPTPKDAHGEAPTLAETGDGTRLEREALAACAKFPYLVTWLREMSPEHFDSETSRHYRALLVEGGSPEEMIELKAELDARAEDQAVTEHMGKELLLRLRERRLRRDLGAAGEDVDKAGRIKAALAEIASAIDDLY